MELQLGIGLSENPIKELGLDLNYSYDYYDHEPKEVVGIANSNKKRCFDEAFEHNNGALPLTLSLLLSNNDDPKDLDNINFFDKNDRDADSVVGWPPINSWRKKLCNQSHEIQEVQNNMAMEINNGGGRRISKSKYVKVKMEGVQIARKVDLSLHNSYQTLNDTLLDMFGKCQQSSNDGYKLTYQDNEGDWLLAADVPWRTFIRSVQRLKMLRICG